MESKLIKLKKLHLGSGLKILKEYINVDLTKKYGAEVVHNLEKFPYPFKDNEFDEILIDNCLEHLEDTIKVMEELHRISKPGGLIKIIVPHSSGYMAFGSVTHKRLFTSASMSFFEKGSKEKYVKNYFKVIHTELRLNRGFILGKIITKLSNINKFTQKIFERHFGIRYDEVLFILKK